MTHTARYVPRADIELTDINKLIKANLEELKKQYEQLIDFTVKGPYVVSLKDYEPGKTFERVEPIGGYSLGLPNAYVCMRVNQTIQDEYFNPFEKNVKETLNKLEDIFKLKIIPSVDCLKELELKVMTPNQIVS